MDKPRKEDYPMLKPILKEQYVAGLKNEAELAEEYGIPSGTISSWASVDGWRAERDRLENLAKKLHKDLAVITDERTEKKALLDFNIDKMLRIAAFKVSELEHDLVAGKPLVDIADLLQTYAATIDKINNTLVKMKNEGIDKKEVTHIHKIDMDMAYQLAKEALAAGKPITINEAAEQLSLQLTAHTNAKPD